MHERVDMHPPMVLRVPAQQAQKLATVVWLVAPRPSGSCQLLRHQPNVDLI